MTVFVTSMKIRRNNGPKRTIYRLVDRKDGVTFPRGEDGEYLDGGGFSTQDKAFHKMKLINDELNKPDPLPEKFRPPNMR